jgi:hypothetical protein
MLGETAIIMTAWRRPQYLKRTLESWSAVDGVRDVHSFTIGLDPSERRVSMLDVIDRARMVNGLDITVRENPERYDNLGNPLETARAVFADPGVEMVVFAEEDLLVSDDVLRYFEWADESFRGDPETLIACAHSEEGALEGADPRAVHFSQRFRCWIWGTWRDRWESVIEPTWDRDYSSGSPEDPAAGWDCNLNNRIIPRGGYRTVLPAASRSQNIGKFEGVHQAPAEYAATVNPSFREQFGVVDYRLSSPQSP